MKGSKYFLDANIFLRIIAKDDSDKLADCEGIIKKIIGGQIKAVISSLVLAEVVWTCMRGFGLTREETTEALNSILGIQNLIFTDKTRARMASELFSKYNVKFIDCLIASHPAVSSGKMIVVSYDRDFDKLHVKRKEPREIM